MTSSPVSSHARPIAGDPRGLLGFFTRLPVGRSATLEDLAAAFPLVPLVGLVTGAIGAGGAVLLALLMPPLPAGALTLALLVGLTGLNQTDGLADLGDGLMVHGDAERRRNVMRDHTVGTGGLSLLLFTYLPAFAGLAEILGRREVDGAWWVAGAVLLVEVAARVPYVFLAYFGRPSHEGLGSAFLEGFGLRHLLVGLLAAAPGFVLAALVVNVAAAGLSLLAAVLVAAALLLTARRLLGGVGGDVMGASQELGRSAAIIAVVVALGV